MTVPNFTRVHRNVFAADAVGMSVVHEVIIGVHCGIKVIGMSLITNMVVQQIESDVFAYHDEVRHAPSLHWREAHTMSFLWQDLTHGTFIRPLLVGGSDAKTAKKCKKLKETRPNTRH